MSDLVKKHCVPCEGIGQPMAAAEAQRYLADVPGWELGADGKSITRRFKFKNFLTALMFVNQIGGLAEAEGHHPDLELGWGRVKVTLTTHALKGLSENDFILAAKIDTLPRG